MSFRSRRAKRGFNGMDLFIILIIAVIVAVGVFVLRGMRGDRAVSPEAEILTVDFTFEFKKQQVAALGSISEGDAVKDPNTKQNIGRVVSVEIKPFSEIAYNSADGSVYMAENPDLCDLIITVRSENATHNDKGYFSGGARLLVGKAADIWSPNFAGSGYCVMISEQGGV